MIDDGLLIHQGVIVAGSSAKKQDTKMGAVKAAMFSDEERRQAMAEAVRRLDPPSILILGTSDKMVDIIARRLELPAPREHIHIEDIATAREMRKAQKMRTKSGTHVIPAPTFQLKKQFSGYFLDPKKAFVSEILDTETRQDRSIVRPTYSYGGSFSISDQVITDIVTHLGDVIEGISSVIWVSADNSEEGMYIRIIVSCSYDADVPKAALEMQSRASRAVAYMTAFNVLGVEVEVWEFR